MIRRIKQIQKEMRDNKKLLECAKQFGLVGDLTRMKIYWLLCKYPELSVGEIAKILNVSISLVSHSLRKLREHHLVKTRKEYKKVFYKLSDTMFGRVLKRNISQL